MKNKIFSTGIYREGLQQTKVPGLAFLALSAVITICNLGNYGSSEAQTCVFMYALSFIVATPLMCLMLFNFLNSRAASDYYHSIPQTRTMLYTSFAAAVLTWSLGGTMLSELLEIFIKLLRNSFYLGNISGTSYATVALYTVVTCLLVEGATLLAMTLTGNLFSQILTTGMILFMPRLLISLFESEVITYAPTLVSLSDRLGGLFDTKCNILFYGFSCLLDGTTTGGFFSNSGEGFMLIYSFALGIVYILLGLYFFNRRASEKATQAATNRWLQCAFRVLCAFAVCLFACDSLIYRICSGDCYDSGETIGISFGMALIVYVLYEVISNRSVKGLLNSKKSMLIGLVLLAALNAAFIGGCVLTINAVLADDINADDVKYIMIDTGNKYVSTHTYGALLVEDEKISERRTIEYAVDNLNDNNRFYSQRVSGSPYSSTYTIRFVMDNGSELRRNVAFMPNELTLFVDALKTNETVGKALLELPCEYDNEYLSYIFSPEQSAEVYDTFVAEYNALSDAEKVQITSCGGLNNSDFNATDASDGSGAELKEYYYTIAELEFKGTYNGKEFYNRYNISAVTPKTAELYMKYKNSSAALDGKKLDSFGQIRDAIDSGKYYYDITVDGGNLYDKSGNYIYTQTQKKYSYGDTAEDTGYDGYLIDWDRLMDELEANYDREPTVDTAFYNVSVSLDRVKNGYVDESSYIQLFIPVDEEKPYINEWAFDRDAIEDNASVAVSGSDIAA